MALDYLLFLSRLFFFRFFRHFYAAKRQHVLYNFGYMRLYVYIRVCVCVSVGKKQSLIIEYLTHTHALTHRYVLSIASGSVQSYRCSMPPPRQVYTPAHTHIHKRIGTDLFTVVPHFVSGSNCLNGRRW